MKKLVDILNYKNHIVKTISITGNFDMEITGISFNSSKIEKDNLFIAFKGTRTDGHNFIDNAIENGASAIVCESLPENINSEVTYIKVENSTESIGKIAANFYDRPSEKIKLVGVTGTNGKTTIATLLYNLFKKLGNKVGLFSTIKYLVNDKEYKAINTTPDAIVLNKLMYEMLAEGCEYCFMEVSSHSVVQNRIFDLNFTGGVFTNITHEHLDYHGSFSEYIKAKKAFFDVLPKGSFALVNKDDKNSSILLQNSDANKYSYGLKSMSDFKSKILETHFDGTLVDIQNLEIWVQLIGEFNIYNATAIYATAILLGQDKNEILKNLSLLKSVDGRFETIKSKNNITAIVDYAHTPDALLNVLKTINEIKLLSSSKKINIITVVGAGGDRDKTKRPEMAKIASELSDKVVLTSDNPRTEDPHSILNDMSTGISKDNISKVLTIENRKEAIKTACMLANEKDLILIAGKGHENYQEINGVRHFFCDKETVKTIFENI